MYHTSFRSRCQQKKDKDRHKLGKTSGIRARKFVRGSEDKERKIQHKSKKTHYLGSWVVHGTNGVAVFL